MKQYIDIVKHVLENGKEKRPVRKNEQTGKWDVVDGGVMTLACPNVCFSHDMSEGFPLLTTKKMAWKSIRVELEGFIKGVTDKKWFQDRGCKIWDEWCNPELVQDHPYIRDFQYDETMSRESMEKEYNERKKAAQKEINDLGTVYGANWRNFDGDYRPRPQILTGLDKAITINTDGYIGESPFGLVGKEFDGKNGVYTVISYDGKDKYHNCRFTVKFHITGFVKDNLCKTQIEDGGVYDPYYPSVCGVACMGEYKTVDIPKLHYEEDKIQTVEALKNQWRQMIQRCYNPKNVAYKNYGECGIYVDNSWLIFENFLREVQMVDGWEFKLDNWTGYHLDKDISNLGYYGLKACRWTTREDNANHTSQQYYFDALDPDGATYFNEYGLSRFCKRYGLNTKTVEAAIKNKTKTHGGWYFYRKDNLQTKPKIRKGTDQLANIVQTLQDNPMDRRMVCSAWNPNQIHMMSLPPCHWGFGVTVIDNELNLCWIQRSVDVPYGLCFNIASYGLLLCLLAKAGGFRRGNLSAMLTDCHIYENQIEGCKEQITRQPRKLPELYLDDFDDIFNWTYDKVRLEGYNPMEKIHFGDIVV